MFKEAEQGAKVSHDDFKKQADKLRLELFDLQGRLRQANFSVILVFAGINAAGRSETLNLLTEWLDPRWIKTEAYDKPNSIEKEFPYFWRFWRDLPAKGQIGLFLGAWYEQILLDHALKDIKQEHFDHKIEQIVSFESLLEQEGVLILKFWMHLSKEKQKKRLSHLENDPLTRWRVTKKDWFQWENYDHIIKSATQLITKTTSSLVPWKIIDSDDTRHRSLSVLLELRDRLKDHLTRQDSALKISEKSSTPLLKKATTILENVNLNQKIEKEDYGEKLRIVRGKIGLLARQAKEQKIPLLILFEGWDAAGKGGAIRRLVNSLDARDYKIFPYAAPTSEELRYHYLWRFWKNIPKDGKIAIFDRSWYGRVLVERVESFAQPNQWQRAYQEINNFEQELVHHGILLIKFFLHISKEEQEERFLERQQIRYKNWKLTDEDWRNREKWDEYWQAIHDMIVKTNHPHAQWTIVPSNDKNFSRLTILNHIVSQLTFQLENK